MCKGLKTILKPVNSVFKTHNKRALQQYDKNCYTLVPGS